MFIYSSSLSIIMKDYIKLVGTFNINKETGMVYYLKTASDGCFEVRKRKGGRVIKGESFESQVVLKTDVKRKKSFMNFVKFNGEGNTLEIYEFPAGRKKGDLNQKDVLI